MKTINLANVYPCSISTVAFLYDLLAERDTLANISHREMPSFEAHRAFIESRPYEAWYVVQSNEEPLGAIYLTKDNEIGIFISKAHQGHGYGKKAIYILMAMHPAKRFLANIAPGNDRSRAMFEKLGFSLIQVTMVKENI